MEGLAQMGFTVKPRFVLAAGVGALVWRGQTEPLTALTEQKIPVTVATVHLTQ
jgi:hypothetical protein